MSANCLPASNLCLATSFLPILKSVKCFRCRDPICDTHLWKVKHDLDMARLRIKELEKNLEAHGLKPPPSK